MERIMDDRCEILVIIKLSCKINCLQWITDIITSDIKFGYVTFHHVNRSRHIMLFDIHYFFAFITLLYIPLHIMTYVNLYYIDDHTQHFLLRWKTKFYQPVSLLFTMKPVQKNSAVRHMARFGVLEFYVWCKKSSSNILLQVCFFLRCVGQLLKAAVWLVTVGPCSRRASTMTISFYSRVLKTKQVIMNSNILGLFTLFVAPYTIQYNTIQYNTIQYNTIQYNTIQYNTIQYNIIQFNTIQYYTIQNNTIQYDSDCILSMLTQEWPFIIFTILTVEDKLIINESFLT